MISMSKMNEFSKKKTGVLEPVNFNFCVNQKKR